MDLFKTLTSRTVVLADANIDTDQIIPARFLTTTNKVGLGRNAFHDWRYDADGPATQNCTLNTINPAEHRVLVAGRNFGCGSSREHAPWALTDFGFRAVADISFNAAEQDRYDDVCKRTWWQRHQNRIPPRLVSINES